MPPIDQICLSIVSPCVPSLIQAIETLAKASINGLICDHATGLASDAAQVLPSGEGLDSTSSGEDVLYDAGNTPNGHLTHLHPYHLLSQGYPVPLATLQGLYNTVTLLPPANGPPHHLVNMSSRFSIPAIHHCSSHASCIAHKEIQLTVDYKEIQLTVDYGENQLTVDYGECLPAIKDHSKDLDNDGEITTKIISTIATDDPITNALLLCGKDSQQPHACIVSFHAHVSQVIGIHNKDLDNDGEITTKLISTITTDDPITDATLLPTFKHGDSFED
jgi:hypothetical protein